MFTLGVEFDIARAYTWANAILTDKYATEAEKVARLIDATENELETDSTQSKG